MKCPVCKGDKYIQEFDSRGVRKYKCRKCGGTGEMNELEYNNSDMAKPTFIEVGEVDKIKQAYIDSELLDIDENDPVVIFTAGYKSADLLPTEKVCPECGGIGTKSIPCDENHYTREECSTCKRTGIIQIYYTPEQYEKIMNKPYPDECLVWRRHIKGWYSAFYGVAKGMKDLVIVQTAQPAPPADYRPEE